MRLRVETGFLATAGYQIRGVGGDLIARGHDLESRTAACADAVGTTASSSLIDAGRRLSAVVVELGSGYNKLGYALSALSYHYQDVDAAAVASPDPR